MILPENSKWTSFKKAVREILNHPVKGELLTIYEPAEPLGVEGIPDSYVSETDTEKETRHSFTPVREWNVPCVSEGGSFRGLVPLEPT